MKYLAIAILLAGCSLIRPKPPQYQKDDRRVAVDVGQASVEKKKAVKKAKTHTVVRDLRPDGTPWRETVTGRSSHTATEAQVNTTTNVKAKVDEGRKIVNPPWWEWPVIIGSMVLLVVLAVLGFRLAAWLRMRKWTLG